MTLPANLQKSKMGRPKGKKTAYGDDVPVKPKGGVKSISNHALEHANHMSRPMMKELIRIAMMDAGDDPKKLMVKEKALVDALKFVLPQAKPSVRVEGRIEHDHLSGGHSLLDVHRSLRDGLQEVKKINGAKHSSLLIDAESEVMDDYEYKA